MRSEGRWAKSSSYGHSLVRRFNQAGATGPAGRHFPIAIQKPDAPVDPDVFRAAEKEIAGKSSGGPQGFRVKNSSGRQTIQDQFRTKVRILVIVDLAQQGGAERHTHSQW